MTDRRVLFYIHKFPPEHRAGAEYYALEVALALQLAGYQVTVAARDVARDYTFEGIPVMGSGSGAAVMESLDRADVVITHLDCTRQAVILCQPRRKPLVHLVHNDRQLGYHRVRPRDAALVVYNSHWIQNAAPFRGQSVVARPAVPVAKYKVDRAGADRVTLVGLSGAKGVKTLNALAAADPARQFLGVEGAYGIQEETPHPNIERLHNTDIVPVYARTRVLIMPSGYESWGRVAMEAACSGIPVIANPTPGLLESLGGAGLFAAHDDIEAWASILARLDDPAVYGAWSAAAAERAQYQEGESKTEMANLIEKIGTLCPAQT